MNVDRVERTGPEIFELVRFVGRHDQGLAGAGLDLLVADGKQAATAADQEGLGVGVPVQLRAAAQPVDVVGNDADVGAIDAAFPLAVEALGVLQLFGWLDDRDHGAEIHGLKSFTPVPSKSRVLRVTTVRS